jgi:hypothetical protein
MKYHLTIYAAGHYPIIEIDEVKFYSLVRAKNILSAAMAIEEKYELLINNFIELEKELLNVTADDILFSTAEYSGFFDIRLSFNRRIVNLLTSTKLYTDQIQQHTKICLPNDVNSSQKVKAFLSKEYDEHFEYRFMEALRNYVQHRGLAVHLTKHDARRTSIEKEGLREYSTKLFSRKEELENDGSFKKSVLEEMSGDIELMSTARKYVESINHAHIQIRELVTLDVKNARELIEGVITDYKNVNNGECLGLSAISYKESEPIDEIINKHQLFLEWDDVRIKLTSKNQRLSNLSKSYVTGNCL